MWPGAPSVLFSQLAHEFRAKEFLLQRPGAEDEFLDDGPERPSEPSAHWNGEPHFPSRQDCLWYQAPERFPRHGCGPEAARVCEAGIWRWAVSRNSQRPW